MREIKFRAWQEENKRMIEWMDIVFNNVMFCCTSIKEGENRKLKYMQYTGIKDGNGKEIYEGDIVKTNSLLNVPLEIVFVDGAFCFLLNEEVHKNDNKVTIRDAMFQAKRNDTELTIEVIGNIYEGIG